jgi:excinuclease UvrABC nuclease subunit
MTTFTAEQVREMTSPGVYQFIKNGQVLYVGMATHGFDRVLSASHHQRAAREVSDTVTFQPCESVALARALEKVMIQEKTPLLNGQYPRVRLSRDRKKTITMYPKGTMSLL